VSEVTIRRDLNELARQEKIERVYGGAILSQRELVQLPIQQRAAMNSEAKRRIGQAAARMVEDGDTIIIGGGTTTAELARNLAARRDLMVITPALNIAYLFAQHPEITVLVTGGIMIGPEVTLAGHFGERALSELHAGKLFLGASAFDPAVGVTSEHVSETGVNRAMIRAARQRTLLIDHSKFGSILTCLVCEAGELDCLITDSEAPAEAVAHLHELGIKVLCK
jgi:DeoR family transcriptional regulator of aga operon